MKKISNLFPSSFAGKFAVGVLLIWIFVALFSPFIANHAPIIAKSDSGWSMPIFSKKVSSKTKIYTFAINPLIKYRYDDLNLESTLKPPLYRGQKGIHLMGTDNLGRDVAAGIVHGARVSLVIASTAILLSLLFGIFIGLVIGYYGDHGIKRNLVHAIEAASRQYEQ